MSSTDNSEKPLTNDEYFKKYGYTKKPHTISGDTVLTIIGASVGIIFAFEMLVWIPLSLMGIWK